MLVPVRTTWIATSGISTSAVKKLDISAEKDVAVKAAMSCWEKLKDIFFQGAHKEAFGYVYDFMKAKYAYEHPEENNDAAADPLKDMDAAIDNLNKKVGTHSDNGARFRRVINDETGEIDIGIVPLDGNSEAGTRLTGNVLGSSGPQTAWTMCKECFKREDKLAAMRILNDITRPGRTVAQDIRSYTKLYELADHARKSDFQIRIEDEPGYAAKIVFTFHAAADQESTVLSLTCRSGHIDDVRKALADCPADMIDARVNHQVNYARPGDEPISVWEDYRTTSSSKLMFAHACLAPGTFEKLFNEKNRDRAIQVFNDMVINGLTSDRAIEFYLLASPVNFDAFVQSFPLLFSAAHVEVAAQSMAPIRNILDSASKKFIEGVLGSEDPVVRASGTPELNQELATRLMPALCNFFEGDASALAKEYAKIYLVCHAIADRKVDQSNFKVFSLITFFELSREQVQAAA